MLTNHQSRALAFIDRYTRASGISPTLTEIGEHLGVSSRSSIHGTVTDLVERGFIRRLPHRARSIEVLRMPPSGELTPQQAWADPMSILRDAVEIIEVLAADRAELHGERCEVADDLLARIKAAVSGAAP